MKGKRASRDFTTVRLGRGLSALKRAINHLGHRVVDGRTSLGKALLQWKANLIADLGGPDAISTQQAALVDLAVKSKLILDTVDVWLLTQPSLINKRARSLLPVVRERQVLADSLARYLSQLGLERRPKQVPSLEEYLAQRSIDGQHSEGASGSDLAGPPQPSHTPDAARPNPQDPVERGARP